MSESLTQSGPRVTPGKMQKYLLVKIAVKNKKKNFRIKVLCCYLSISNHVRIYGRFSKVEGTQGARISLETIFLLTKIEYSQLFIGIQILKTKTCFSKLQKGKYVFRKIKYPSYKL